MPGKKRKLPIGIQNFKKLISDGYLYIDKTEYIYKLVQEGGYYFLSRPRRFGKSLFLSALKSYWEGDRALFTGLAIEELTKDVSNAFEAYPVFYFDFNKDNFKADNGLEIVIDRHLKTWEEELGVPNTGETLAGRFQALIDFAYEKTGKQVVILVDEYDKPLLEVMVDEKLEEHNKAVFKGFFSTLKSYDERIKFAFLTGVTKSSKVSIFSDLNQLRDISMSEQYSCICGITDNEIRNFLMQEITQMADKLKTTQEDCLLRLKQMYNGYHFSIDSESVYNPFCLLNALTEMAFDTYWFSTGTPTFLVEKLKSVDFDPESFTDGSIMADSNMLSDYRGDNPDPVPLLYQTGYLTIKDYNEEDRIYTLGFPNDEVKYAMLESLAPAYLYDKKGKSRLNIFNLKKYIQEGNVDGMRDIFTALYANIPYPEGADTERPLEQNFQNVIYIVITMLGKYVRTEVHNAAGRADAIVETPKFVYLFEFKRDKSADAALSQIEERGYDDIYAADDRMIYKIGVNLNSETRKIDGWKVDAGHGKSVARDGYHKNRR